MKDNAMELFVEVNREDVVIGPIERAVANSSPERVHRSVKVLIVNAKAELLLQRRSATKDRFPDCWDVSVAGHVDWGEEYVEAAVRETAEEVGLIVCAGELRRLGKLLIELDWETEFQLAYELRLGELADFHFPADEVAELRWVSRAELQRMVADDSVHWASPALTHLRAWAWVD